MSLDGRALRVELLGDLPEHVLPAAVIAHQDDVGEAALPDPG